MNFGYYSNSVISNPITYEGDRTFFRLTRNRIGWKKVRVVDKNSWRTQSGIAKLLLPAGTRVYDKSGDFIKGKCSYHDKYGWHKMQKLRASQAIVIGLVSLDTGRPVSIGISMYDNTYEYWLGKICRPRTRFSTNQRVCDSGIHFFMKRSDAVEYRS